MKFFLQFGVSTLIQSTSASDSSPKCLSTNKDLDEDNIGFIQNRHKASHQQQLPTPRCGFAATRGECQNGWDTLKSYGSHGPIMGSYGMECMGYGGTRDPCTLSLTNDEGFGEADMYKNPSNCVDRVALFLWDEPCTQAQRNIVSHNWKNPAYVAGKWIEYADRFQSELRSRRAAGMKVTSPLFHNGCPESGSATDQIINFFANCADCSNPSSHRYIDVIARNDWVGDWDGTGISRATMQGQVNWIKDEARKSSQGAGNRKVWLGNFGCLGNVCNADKQIEVIQHSGMFDFDGAVESVYYFAALDYGGGTSQNKLTDYGHGSGMTIGQALVQKCGGGVAPSPPSPTPPRRRRQSGCTPVTSGQCYNDVVWAMNNGIYSNPEWYHGLTPSSSFEEFQLVLHQGGHGGCPAPCTGTCTGSGQDPFQSGAEIACCAGLSKQLSNWNGDSNWFYKCLPGSGSVHSGPNQTSSNQEAECESEDKKPQFCAKKASKGKLQCSKKRHQKRCQMTCCRQGR